MESRLLTPDEAAERLGHSADYWKRRARRKEVPHVRIGAAVRFTEADIEAIIAAARVEPVDPLRSITTRSAGHTRQMSGQRRA